MSPLPSLIYKSEFSQTNFIAVQMLTDVVKENTSEYNTW